MLMPEAEITGAATHPSEPWLATSSMTPHGEGEGQLVVWDLREARPVSVFDDEHGFGFESDEGALLWAPSGRRLAASAGTNGVAVVEAGKLLTLAFPDETRDHQVPFCWMGSESRLYSATSDPPKDGGLGVAITVGPPDGALKPTPAGVPSRVLRRLVYNGAIGAVVGDDLVFLTAVDVDKGLLRYEVPLAKALPKPTIGSVPTAWSADGRRAAVAAPAGAGASTVTIFDGDDGQELARVSVAGEVGALRWTPPQEGVQRALAVVTGPKSGDPRHVHVVETDRVVRTIDAPLATQAFRLADARTVAWSPDGTALAMLLRDGAVRLVDVASGRTRATVETKGRLVVERLNRPGVLWAAPDRIVGLAPRLIGIWTTEGELLAHHEVSRRG